MILTGCRPSSAMVQLWEDIDLKRRIIKIQNVKTGKRKKKPFYFFPIYSELKILLDEMKFKKNVEGRLFHQFKLNELNYTYPLSFWERAIRTLKLGKQISGHYTLKQIRSTTASFMVNDLGMDIYAVKKLLDHVDIKITEKHYAKLNLRKVRDELDDFSIDQFLEGKNEFE